MVVFSFLFHFPFFYIPELFFYKSFFSPDKVLVQAFTVYFTMFNKFEKIFLIYKEICKGAGAKSYMYEGRFHNYRRKCANISHIFEEAVSHILLCTRFLQNLPFFFNSVVSP